MIERLPRCCTCTKCRVALSLVKRGVCMFLQANVTIGVFVSRMAFFPGLPGPSDVACAPHTQRIGNTGATALAL